MPRGRRLRWFQTVLTRTAPSAMRLPPMATYKERWRLTRWSWAGCRRWSLQLNSSGVLDWNAESLQLRRAARRSRWRVFAMSNDGVTRRNFLGALAAVPLAVKEARAAETPAKKWKLVVASDHFGFPMKGPLIQTLKSWGHSVTDIGVYATAPADFPDIAQKLSDDILSGRCERGIMVCGTGVGASIAVNKVRGMRATLCHD